MLRLLQTTTTLGEEAGDLLEQGKDLVGGILNQVDLGETAEKIKAEPLLLAILIGVGVLTAIIFFWGITKQLFKAAIIAGALSVGSWIWYFNYR